MIKNAKITGTLLGVEDHGIVSCMLYLDYGGTSQGFGGYALDTYEKGRNHPILGDRLGTAYGLDLIMCILKVVGVGSWEKLEGQHVRVKTEGDFGVATAIGHFLKDEWLDIKAHAESWQPQEVADGKD